MATFCKAFYRFYSENKMFDALWDKPFPSSCYSASGSSKMPFTWYLSGQSTEIPHCYISKARKICFTKCPQELNTSPLIWITAEAGEQCSSISQAVVIMGSLCSMLEMMCISTLFRWFGAKCDLLSLASIKWFRMASVPYRNGILDYRVLYFAVLLSA